jgi:hypothetical protein
VTPDATVHKCLQAVGRSARGQADSHAGKVAKPEIATRRSAPAAYGSIIMNEADLH